MTPLQNRLLEMLEWITRYLDTKSLRYYAVGGTLLGAMRHSGFIPWDDDVDIAMPRSDYMQLLSLLKTQVDHYVVESCYSASEDYCYPAAKLYDTRTTLIEHLRKDIIRGVYIDIFPLDGLGNTLEEAKNYYKNIDWLNMLHAMRTSTYRNGRVWWKNIAASMGTLLPVNAKKLAIQANNKCLQRNYDDYRYVANCFSTYRAKEILPREVFGNAQLMKFEHISIRCPERPEVFLEQIFGNWEELPPENKRCSAHDHIRLDFNMPYMQA